MHPAARDWLALIPENARVLDCGGWFQPLARADHVVDLMPYETRGARLQTEPLPGERFRKETWHQVNFLATDLRLPFADGEFDFVYCSHTLEDLADPFPLLRELGRVARAGCLVTPSRLSEQTAGARDRMSGAPGHPHHHWIVDTHAGRPRFAPKAASLRLWWRGTVPLRVAERVAGASGDAAEWVFPWRNELAWEQLDEKLSAAVAEKFARDLGVGLGARALDALIRRLRRLKHGRRRHDPAATRRGWEEIVALSQPFSRLPLS